MAIGLFLLKPSFKKSDEIVAPKPEEGISYVTRIVLFLTFVTCFTNVDILLVKHHFLHEEAAQYVASAFMSRILFLSAASIGFALFPKTAAIKPGEGGPLLSKSLLYYLAFAVPFIAICSLFPDFVVGLCYGEAYGPAARILPRMLFAYGLIGAAYLIGTYRVSRNRRLVWVAFCVASVLQAVLIAFWPGNTLRVAWYMILCATVLIAISLVPFGKGKMTADKESKVE
jgi:O-antigen/teichoic acid export membrane protein